MIYCLLFHSWREYKLYATILWIHYLEFTAYYYCLFLLFIK